MGGGDWNKKIQHGRNHYFSLLYPLGINIFCNVKTMRVRIPSTPQLLVHLVLISNRWYFALVVMLDHIDHTFSERF